MTDLSKIRNFSIIAHIDHGKSTLADRLIQRTGGLTAREMVRGQMLDNMDIEQERGITIKAQTVRLQWVATDGESYTLNLMDTPGHVDFAYEVSRSLAACEGALLVVDAAQGVEAQTLANVYQSIEHDHEIVPVINKIDLPAAEPEKVRHEIEDIIGLDASDAVLDLAPSPGSASTRCFEAIVDQIPPPKGDRAAPLEGDAGRQLVRPLSRRRHPGPGHRRRDPQGPAGQVHGRRHPAPGRPGRLLHAPRSSAGRARPPGEIGFITAQIKEVGQTAVGDTITDAKRPTARGAARLQGGPAGGVLRPVPGRRGRFREAARKPLQAAPQRRLFSFEMEIERGARASASAAASSASPPRDHPGAADPRI